jgi:hypothetical protein
MCQALAPLAFGLLIEPMGRSIVIVSSALSIAALLALVLLPTKVEKWGTLHPSKPANDR